MTNQVENRKKIIESLREELVGPSPQGRPINFQNISKFQSKEEASNPWYDETTKEEILNRDSPTVRYGIGVLYPMKLTINNQNSIAASSGTNIVDISEEETETNKNAIFQNSSGSESLEEIINRRGTFTDKNEDSDFEIATSNDYKPSSMGISFLANCPPDATLLIEVSGGRYIRKEVSIEGSKYPAELWLRQPVTIEASFNAADFTSPSTSKVKPSKLATTNTEGLKISIEVLSRPYSHQSLTTRLITACVVNRAEAVGMRNDTLCLFQTHLKATIISSESAENILPYPGLDFSHMDNEEKSLALLYLDKQAFGIGHGCAADWSTPSGEGYVSWISAECLPSHETPSITPDITQKDGTPIRVSMATLAGLQPDQDGLTELNTVIQLYESWIEEKSRELQSVPAFLQTTANNHLDNCRKCAKRMRTGLDYLRSNSKALQAFQLANHAMLLQQINTERRKPRSAKFNTKQLRWEFLEPYEALDPMIFQSSSKGNWRAFQIGFLLMALESTGQKNSLDRDIVELIWFPTGGGKTEAYLGLAAFSMFLRRLENPNDAGVSVLMRYTLRLLTAQQFQRASSLICAMEYIRQKNTVELGDIPFSIGIWLGSDTTPNTRSDAVQRLNKLKNDYYAENPFLLSRCPWCNAQMGKNKDTTTSYKSSVVPRVIGYEQQAGTVVYKCVEPRCPFRSGLPIYVIDEDLYDKCPSLVIGTVDKFAMLAWRPKARSIFGIDSSGKRLYSPPGLIIQDELHLIAGPLGSMVGLYELVIEELCTDYRISSAVKPKIVCSTATIRRYAAQIKALYGRTEVTLFPSPGLNVSDSFFARYARDKSGSLSPGRLYVGVHAPGLGSMQTVEVRTFTSLTQAAKSIDLAARDPWWTLLIFFNSLRELGTTLTLFQSDIPDYIKVFKRRTGIREIRYPSYYKELTSRLRNDEITQAIDDLEIGYDNSESKTIDTCLASNIIEVGIDVDRLSLMAVVGQPKTTAQYIQVTGRVGRRWQERPGLVITLYGASKPRDRSHFEKFRTYHERLYAQVEPTSVTPFSPPALDRALHAVMAAYVRQLGNPTVANSPSNFPADLINNLRELLIKRIRLIDSEEIDNFIKVFEKREREWKEWRSSRWSRDLFDDQDDYPLLREAGGYADGAWKRISWATPTSMRNVDSSCQVEITNLYLRGAENG